MPQGNGVGPRLRQAAGLPQTLAAGFDAFEAIRMAARDYQDRVPELFAAFMTTADTAVDGRKLSPSRPHSPSMVAPSPALRCQAVRMRVRPPMPWPRSQPCSAIVSADAAALADTPGDRAACQEAAAAAGRICQLMTR